MIIPVSSRGLQSSSRLRRLSQGIRQFPDGNRTRALLWTVQHLVGVDNTHTAPANILTYDINNNATVTLAPAINYDGQLVIIKRVTASTSPVKNLTIQGFAGELIDDAASHQIASILGRTSTLWSDGEQWWRLYKQ